MKNMKYKNKFRKVKLKTIYDKNIYIRWDGLYKDASWNVETVLVELLTGPYWINDIGKFKFW